MNANTSGFVTSVYAEASIQACNSYKIIAALQLAIDLTNGFCLLLAAKLAASVSAFKTNVATTGPIHASSADFQRPLRQY